MIDYYISKIVLHNKVVIGKKIKITINKSKL